MIRNCNHSYFSVICPVRVEEGEGAGMRQAGYEKAEVDKSRDGMTQRNTK